MSDFLLVIPEGWTQLDWQYITNNIIGMDKAGVEAVIASGVYLDMQDKLWAENLIPTDKVIIEAKLIDDTYFMVRLG